MDWISLDLAICIDFQPSDFQGREAVYNCPCLSEKVGIGSTLHLPHDSFCLLPKPKSDTCHICTVNMLCYTVRRIHYHSQPDPTSSIPVVSPSVFTSNDVRAIPRCLQACMLAPCTMLTILHTVHTVYNLYCRCMWSPFLNLHCPHQTHSITTASFHPSDPWPYVSDSSDNVTDVPFKSASNMIHLSILLSHYICAHPDTVVIGLGSGGSVIGASSVDWDGVGVVV